MIMKNGKLLLQRVENKKETDGIIYTDDHAHKSFEGIVVATTLGGEYKLKDRVLFSEFAGEEVWVDSEKYLIVDEENIWCVREDK